MISSQILKKTLDLDKIFLPRGSTLRQGVDPIELYRAALKVVAVTELISSADRITPHRSQFIDFDEPRPDSSLLAVCGDVLLLHNNGAHMLVKLEPDGTQKTISVRATGRSVGVADCIVDNAKQAAIIAFFTLIDESISFHVTEILLDPDTFGSQIDHIETAIPGLHPGLALGHRILLRGNHVCLFGEKPSEDALTLFFVIDWRKRKGRSFTLSYPSEWDNILVRHTTSKSTIN